MCRSTGELAASTCAKRVKSRGEAGFLRMATAIRGMPGSEFEPRRPLQKHHPIGWCFFVCASALTVVSAGCRRLPQPTAGTLPRKRLASSAAGGASALSSSPAPKTPPYRWCFFVCASALTVVSAGCRRLRVSAYCAIFRVVMTRKWGRWTRFRQNNRYFAFFLAMEKSMWYTDAEYNSECAGGLHRCGLGAPLLRAVAGNVCTHDRDPVHRRRRDIAAPHGGLTEPGRRP